MAEPGPLSIQQQVRRTSLIVLLWLAADFVTLAPHGTVFHIREFDAKLDRTLRESPFQRLCYSCSGPAVQWAEYNDGTRRYFCDRHPPPSTAMAHRSNQDKEMGQKGLNPWTCYIMLALVLVPNTIRATIHRATNGRRFKMSIRGALAGLVFAILAYAWFYSHAH